MGVGSGTLGALSLARHRSNPYNGIADRLCEDGEGLPLDTDPRARIVGGMMGAAQFEARDPQFEARVRASFAKKHY
jgi:hypothetical protein